MSIKRRKMYWTTIKRVRCSLYMNVSRPGPVYTNSDTFQWWIQGRGPPPLFFLRPEGPEKIFFLILLPLPPPPPPLSEGLGSPLLLKPQNSVSLGFSLGFTRFRVDGAFNLHGERSHKERSCGRKVDSRNKKWIKMKQNKKKFGDTVPLNEY